MPAQINLNKRSSEFHRSSTGETTIIKQPSSQGLDCFPVYYFLMTNEPNTPISVAEMSSVAETARAIVGHAVPPEAKSSFADFQRYVSTDPKPRFVTDAEANSNATRWLRRLTEGVLEATQNALCCAYYHCDRISEMEHRVIDTLSSTGIVERLRANNAAIVPLNTIALDAEYQAFILAARRCLDYLARAIAAFFRSDFHSFRRLGGFLAGREPVVVSYRLQAEYHRHADKFTRALFSIGENKSTRDLISHYEYVSAGCLSIGPHGVILMGGGEQIGWNAISKDQTLTKLICDHRDLLQACIEGLLKTLIDSSRQLG